MTGDPATTTVAVIDDHRLLVDALVETLSAAPGLEVVGSAEDLRSGLELVAATQPNVVLIDVRLPDGDGAQGSAEIATRSPDSRVLVLTAQEGVDVVARAVEAGAVGFLAKTTPLPQLVEAIRRVAQGAILFTPYMLRDVAEHLRGAQHTAGPELTTREQEILEDLAAGRATAEIAEIRFLSPHTVRNHIRNLTQKLDAHSRLEAVAIATRLGLLQPGGDDGQES